MKHVYTSLMKTQSTMVKNISLIYPIQEDRICSFLLSNSVFTKLDREEVAIGLGYTSHALILISNYLYIPLRYPIQFKSSRSTIWDRISKSVVKTNQY
jgi:hypothetical protein